MTKGYGMPARHIIHTVGPVWNGGGHGEAEMLRKCYVNSLSLALTAGAGSVAFPCISTGIFGYPAEAAAAIAVAAVREFLLSPGNLEEVIFCCFSPADLNIYNKLIA